MSQISDALLIDRIGQEPLARINHSLAARKIQNWWRNYLQINEAMKLQSMNPDSYILRQKLFEVGDGAKTVHRFFYNLQYSTDDAVRSPLNQLPNQYGRYAFPNPTSSYHPSDKVWLIYAQLIHTPKTQHFFIPIRNMEIAKENLKIRANYLEIESIEALDRFFKERTLGKWNVLVIPEKLIEESKKFLAQTKEAFSDIYLSVKKSTTIIAFNTDDSQDFIILPLIFDTIEGYFDDYYNLYRFLFDTGLSIDRYTLITRCHSLLLRKKIPPRIIFNPLMGLSDKRFKSPAEDILAFQPLEKFPPIQEMQAFQPLPECIIDEEAKCLISPDQAFEQQLPKLKIHSLASLVSHPVFKKFSTILKDLEIADDTIYQREMICSVLKGMLTESSEKIESEQLTFSLNLILSQIKMFLDQPDFQQKYLHLQLIFAEIQMLRIELQKLRQEKFEPDFQELMKNVFLPNPDSPHEIIYQFVPNGGMAALSKILASCKKKESFFVAWEETERPYFEVLLHLNSCAYTFSEKSLILTPATDRKETKQPDKIDLLLKDFHIPCDPLAYGYPEMETVQNFDMVLERLKSKIGESFTLAVDMTFDSYDEPLLKKLALMIQKKYPLINLVFWRSCTKMDFFGTNLGYGGLIVAINNPKLYGDFNKKLHESICEKDHINFMTYCDIMTYASKQVNQRIKDYNKRTAAVLSKHKKNFPHLLPSMDEKRPYLEISMCTYPTEINKNIIIKKKIVTEFIKFADKFFDVSIKKQDSFGFSLPTVTEIYFDIDAYVKGMTMRLSSGLLDKDSLELFDKFIKCLKYKYLNEFILRFDKSAKPKHVKHVNQCAHEKKLLEADFEKDKELIISILRNRNETHERSHAKYQNLASKSPGSLKEHYQNRATFHLNKSNHLKAAIQSWIGLNEYPIIVPNYLIFNKGSVAYNMR